MELDDLKTAWELKNAKLEENLQVNQVLLKEATVNKIKSVFNETLLASIIEIVVYVLFSTFMIPFMIDHWTDQAYKLPSLILVTLTLFNIVWHIQLIVFFGKLNYNTPIVRLQKGLWKFRLLKFWESNLTFIVVPIFFLSLVAVCVKALFNLDFYSLASSELVIHLVVWSLIGAVIVWFVAKYDRKKYEKVNTFLDQITKFEQQ